MENLRKMSLSAEQVSNGLKTLGIHPLDQRHVFLELSLMNLSVADVSLLRNYPSILYLNISGNQISSLEALETMKSLVQLRAR